MRKILFAVPFLFAALSVQAQEEEKVLNIQKTDGTTAKTRLADMKQISFLSTEEAGQGLLVKTIGGETAAVLFEANPVVTVNKGKLTVKSSTKETFEFEISDIAEITFGDAADATGIKAPDSFSYVMQEGGVVLRNIPKGVKPFVYSIDGRSLPTPSLRGDELRLDRATLGSGIFIVKVGTLSAKIRL